MIWKDERGYLELIAEYDKFGVFLDMGMGKTALLLALADRKLKEGIKKILIVAPKNVTLKTWQNEMKKWENFTHLIDKTFLIQGTPKQRIKMYQNVGQSFIHIISSDLMEWVTGTWKKPKGRPRYFVPNKHSPKYEMIIVDECSQFSDTKTARFKALKRLDPPIIYLLSGTPFSNIEKEKNYYLKADDGLYYICYFLDLYKKTKYDFQNDFCFKVKWDQFKWRMHEKIYDALIEKINTVSISKKLKIKAKKLEHTIWCDMDDKRMKTLKKEFYLKTDRLERVTVANKGQMINKALQLGSGFVYDETKEVKRLNYYRFEKLKELLMVLNDNIIIFYNFVEDKELLLRELEGARTYNGKEDEEAWVRGEIPYFILSPFSSQFGLNLQDGGSRTIIWYGLIWSAENYTQANARLYRTGQKRDTEIYYILARNSMDQYVYDKLVRKIDTMDKFKEYVKEDL